MGNSSLVSRRTTSWTPVVSKSGASAENEVAFIISGRDQNSARDFVDTYPFKTDFWCLISVFHLP